MAISSRSHWVLIQRQQGLMASRAFDGWHPARSTTLCAAARHHCRLSGSIPLIDVLLRKDRSAQETLGQNSELAKARKRSCGMRLEIGTHNEWVSRTSGTAFQFYAMREIWSDRYRLHFGFASKQEALTCGARRLNGEFLECSDRMLKLAAFQPLLLFMGLRISSQPERVKTHMSAVLRQEAWWREGSCTCSSRSFLPHQPKP